MASSEFTRYERHVLVTDVPLENPVVINDSVAQAVVCELSGDLVEEIVEVRVLNSLDYNSENARCIIQFTSPESAQEASFELNGKLMNEKRLRAIRIDHLIRRIANWEHEIEARIASMNNPVTSLKKTVLKIYTSGSVSEQSLLYELNTHGRVVEIAGIKTANSTLLNVAISHLFEALSIELFLHNTELDGARVFVSLPSEHIATIREMFGDSYNF